MHMFRQLILILIVLTPNLRISKLILEKQNKSRFSILLLLWIQFKELKSSSHQNKLENGNIVSKVVEHLLFQPNPNIFTQLFTIKKQT